MNILLSGGWGYGNLGDDAILEASVRILCNLYPQSKITIMSYEPCDINIHGYEVIPSLHRAIFGTFDRFTAYLIEETKGAFPLWLSPKQVVVIPVHFEKHTDYAYKVCDLLKEKGVRVHVDNRNEKLGYRIREAQMSKVPYQLVVGDNEMENESVNIRKYGVEGSESMKLSDFAEKIHDDIVNRK